MVISAGGYSSVTLLRIRDMIDSIDGITWIAPKCMAGWIDGHTTGGLLVMRRGRYSLGRLTLERNRIREVKAVRCVYRHGLPNASGHKALLSTDS